MIQKAYQWIVRNVFKAKEPDEPIATYRTPCIYCGAAVTAAKWIPPERVCCVDAKLFEESHCGKLRAKAKEDRRQIELMKQAIRELEVERSVDGE